MPPLRLRGETLSSVISPTVASPSLGRVRVLHIIQNLNYGGMERLLADIVRGVDRSRFESHVLVLQYLGRFAQGLEEVAGLHVAGRMSSWSMLRPESLAKQIRQIGPDVVHSHSGVWYKATLAARMAGVPRVIHTEHGRGSPDLLRHRLIDSIASHRTDVVVAVSERLRAQLVQSRIASANRVRTVTNGVDTTVFCPRADDGVLRRELGLSGDTPILGSIGRLESIKGYDVMVEAFAILLSVWRDGAKPILVIAGEGSERVRLEARIRELGMSSAVRLLGWRNDTQSLHSAFTAFTLSSRSEGTSVSLLEAMSSGLCPIVTRVGGNAAVLGDSLAHRLVPSEDPESLANAWQEGLLDHECRRRDGDRSRQRVRSAFDVKAMVEAYERLYTERSRSIA